MKYLILVFICFNLVAEDFHVIGEDSRVQIQDSAVSFYRSVGKITSGCSGTLISPKHVLTAAHCIYDNEKKVFSLGHNFIPGAVKKGSYPFGAYNWKKAYLLKEYVSKDENIVALDFAVIELEKEVSSYDPNLIKLLNTDDSNILDFDSVSINGYPGEKKKNTLWSDKCRSKNLNESELKFICDSTKGMSGSGILYHTENENYLISVNSGGMTITDSFGNIQVYNQGAKITENVFNQINRWVLSEFQDETYVLENTENYHSYKITSNCENGLDFYFTEDLDQVINSTDKVLITKDKPLTLKLKSNKVYYHADVIGENSYFGSSKYFVNIDGKNKKGSVINMDSDLYSKMNFTLNCK